MYIDTRSMGPEEKSRMRRKMMMEQVSFQSDLKKVEREQQELKDELRRFEQERDRIEIYIKENHEKMRRSIDRMDFLQEELRRLKKAMIEVG